MFRFLKFAAYAFLGYFIYEMVLGVADRHPVLVPATKSRQAENHFKTEEVFDSSGARRSQKVGRGVLS